LTQAAVNLGVANAATITKDARIQEIKRITNSDGELLLTPLVIAPLPQPAAPQAAVPQQSRWWWIPGLLTLLSALAAATTAGLTYWIASANATSAKANADSAKTASDLYQAELQKMREAAEKDVEQANAKARTAWQEIIVYGIISQGMKDKWNGLTQKEIQAQYRTEAVQKALQKDSAKRKDQDVEIRSEDLSDYALVQILFSLMEKGLVGETTDDRYVTNKTLVNPRWQRGSSDFQISGLIFQILLGKAVSEPYTVDSLFKAVADQIAVKNEDYRTVLGTMQKEGFVRIEDGKVWSPTNPPKKEKKEK
jgi:hypothetical protein